MESTVEQRLNFLENRVKTLEGLLGVAAASSPARTVPPVPQPTPRKPAAPAAKPVLTPEPTFDLEELLGGRVLGWVGGVAVVIAAVFFVVMAVRNGWIGEAARMELAFAASTALVAAGIWLYERRGRTQAALATVAAGLAALYASDAATTLHYHLLSPPVGLVIAGIVGAVALVTAVRWDSREIAGIGIVGSLLAPVFVDAGTQTSSLVFMTIALIAAIAVVVQRGWAWLAVVAYVVSAPQAAAWLNAEHTHRLGLTLVVATAFWLLYVVAAIGHELRAPTESLRLSSASLLLANASVTAAGVWWLLDDAGHREGANAWLFALAGAHVVLGTLVLRSRASREIALLLYGVAAALVGIAVTVTLDGPAVVAAWSAEALVLAWAGMRGVVSLAVAIALPVVLLDGRPFPSREAVLIVTLTVIVFTLLGQGLTLPWLIRRLHLGTDLELREEESHARQELVAAATRRIDQLYPVWPGHRPLLDRLRAKYEHRSEHVERQRDPSGDGGADQEIIEHHEIERTILDSEREALLRLRADGAIDDDVLRTLERELDLEERRAGA